MTDFKIREPVSLKSKDAGSLMFIFLQIAAQFARKI